MRKPVAFLLAFLMIFVMLTVVACDFGGSGTTEPGTTPTTPTTPSTPTTPTTSTTPTIPSTEPQPPVVKDIDLVFSSVDAISVAAGEDITLPTVTATDYDGTDLTANIEIEDPAESGTVKNGVFNARIAGDHNLYYYVEVADEEAEEGVRYAEYTLKVVVTPATANTFDVEGHDDVNQMTEYGVFKDGFEAGKKSPLGAAIGDSNNATYITATSEAIEGNSLIIDFNRTAGSALNAVFLSAFNNTFHRGILATYKVKFSYKIITSNNNTGDIYFGLSWDGSNGINGKFVSDGAEVGQVYTYETTFTSAQVPESGNAYFIFFKLSGSTSDVLIAVDNFEIETIYVEPVNSVVPTAEQLQSENGFTWDFGTNGATSTNGETIRIDSLSDKAQNRMEGNEHFHTYLMKLTNADGHLFSGLTRDNLVAGKKMILDMYYYTPNAASEGGFHLIMMGDSGNPTQTVTKEEVTGNIRHIHLETTVQSGWYQLNIYGQGNANFEIYLSELTVKLVDPDPTPADTTPNGYKIGEFKFDVNSRQFDGGVATKTGWTVSKFDNYNFGTDAENMGSAPSKFVLNGASNVTMEWFQANGRIESGFKYKITVKYYVVSWEGGRMTLNFDNNVFPELCNAPTTGYHEAVIEWTADRNVDFFSFFVPGDGNTVTATMYVTGVTVELVG